LANLVTCVAASILRGPVVGIALALLNRMLHTILKTFAFVLLASIAVTAFAAEKGLHYLSPDSIDLTHFRPPPEENSPQDLADLETVIAVSQTKSDEDCSKASTIVNLDVYVWFGLPDGPLSKEQLKPVAEIATKVMGDAFSVAHVVKKKFDRKRPYLRSSEKVKLCVAADASSSYPSGHSAAAEVGAQFLAQIYPDKRQELMHRAQQIAYERIVGGVHHPADTYAGMQIGDLVFDALGKNTQFKQDLDAVLH